jgi:hypothetical protein
LAFAKKQYKQDDFDDLAVRTAGRFATPSTALRG